MGVYHTFDAASSTSRFFLRISSILSGPRLRETEPHPTFFFKTFSFGGGGRTSVGGGGGGSNSLGGGGTSRVGGGGGGGDGGGGGRLLSVESIQVDG